MWHSEADYRYMEINIAKVIESKTGKKLPRWIARLLQRLIHEREINAFIRRHEGEQGQTYLAALHRDFDVQVEWLNPEALPEDGRCIFVSNHPLGAFDGIGISYLLARRYGDVRYIVNDMLYHLDGLRSVFVPVNTYGSQSRGSIQALHSVLESDLPVGSFPAGYCSRHYDGAVQDRPWQKSFISQAIQYRRNVVPLHFVGRNSKHFYWIDRIRRALGVKFDICTALLPDEMFRSSGKSYQVIVGEPIAWEELRDAEGSMQEKAARVRAMSYELPQRYTDRIKQKNKR